MKKIMKIVKRVLFVLFVLLFCSNQLHAQNSLFEAQDLSKVNIDDYSDNQIMAFYNKAMESGLTETQLYKMVAQKGLPESEVLKLRERLDALAEKKVNIASQNDKVETSDIPHPYDTSGL